jgi:enoyl-CoA hydratase/carnithine racemase
LGEEEFWALTPAQFKALCDRLEAQHDRDYWRAGVIASTVANFSNGYDRKKHPKAFKTAEFMPQKPKKKKKPMYTDEQLRAIERISTLLGIGADRGVR